MPKLKTLMLITSAVILLSAVTAFAAVLFIKRPNELGSNHIPAFYPVVTLDSSESVCQPKQVIPSGTRLISLTVLANNLKPDLQMKVITRSHSFLATQVKGWKRGQALFQIDKNTALKVAKICLTNKSAVKVQLSGVGSFYPNLAQEYKSYLIKNGRKIDSEISIKYFGTNKKSYFQLIPAIAHRASLFRISIIGPWFYYILPLLTILISLLGIGIAIKSGTKNE